MWQVGSKQKREELGKDLRANRHRQEILMLSGRWDTHTRLLRHHAKVEAFCFGRPARMFRSLNLIDFHFGSSACDALLFVFGPGIPNVRWECACVGPNSRLGPLATGIRGGADVASDCG